MKLTAVLLLIGSWSFLLLHTSAAPYLNNQWKPHRWATEAYKTSAKELAEYQECEAHVKDSDHEFRFCVDPRVSFVPLQFNIRGEEAKFDICLEHGELRRIK